MLSKKWMLPALSLWLALALPSSISLAQPEATESASNEIPSSQEAPSPEVDQRLFLTKSTMCERVENLSPVHPAVVFSASVGQVCAFTSFDPVPQPTLIYHRWFHRDELSTQTRLRLYPPKWATYSVIQLRETDKGPWRVEVTDQNGHVLKVFRFSITD